MVDWWSTQEDGSLLYWYSEWGECQYTLFTKTKSRDSEKNPRPALIHTIYQSKSFSQSFHTFSKTIASIKVKMHVIIIINVIKCSKHCLFVLPIYYNNYITILLIVINNKKMKPKTRETKDFQRPSSNTDSEIHQAIFPRAPPGNNQTQTKRFWSRNSLV